MLATCWHVICFYRLHLHRHIYTLLKKCRWSHFPINNISSHPSLGNLTFFSTQASNRYSASRKIDISWLPLTFCLSLFYFSPPKSYLLTLQGLSFANRIDFRGTNSRSVAVCWPCPIIGSIMCNGPMIMDVIFARSPGSFVLVLIHPQNKNKTKTIQLSGAKAA